VADHAKARGESMESNPWLTKDQMAALRAMLERNRVELSTLEAKGADAQDERARLRLAAVRSALMRLDNGTYGECVRCDEPLGFEQLEARPEAALCPACEAARRIR